MQAPDDNLNQPGVPRLRTRVRWLTPVVAAVVLLSLALPGDRPGAADPSSPAPRSFSLPEAIDLAMAQNPSIVRAGLAADKAAIQAATAERRYEDASVHDFTSRMPLGPDPMDQNTVTMLKSQAETGLSLAQAGRQLVGQALRMQVQRAYLEARKAREGEKIAQADQARAEAQFKVAQARLDAGMAPRSEVLNAQARLTMARAAAARAGRLRKMADITLRQVVGLDQHTPLVLTTSFGRGAVSAVAGVDLEAKISQALAQRFDVLQARDALQLQQTNFQLIDRRYLSQTDVWKLADLDVRDAQAHLAEVQSQVDAQVRQAHLRLQMYEEQLQAFDQGLEAAREGVRLATASYGVGLATPADVTNAETALTQLEAQSLQTLFDYNLARLDFDTATGEGLK